jgi:hypothetical protein
MKDSAEAKAIAPAAIANDLRNPPANPMMERGNP